MIDRAEPTVSLKGDVDEANRRGALPGPVPPLPALGGGGGAPLASAQSQTARAADQAPPIVDPAVCRRKFDREIQNFRAMEAEYLRRGWILLRAEYPEVVVLFAAPQLNPPAVTFGVQLDFTNFDFWPASVRFVKPFTLEPLTAAAMPTQLLRRVPKPGGEFEVQPLLQFQADQVPFLCTRGVREYHHHPAHSNDPWLAYRGTGVGTLYHILNLIHRHGIVPMKQYALQIQMLQCAIGFPPPDAASIPE